MTISKATLLSVLTKTKAKQDAQNEATYVKKETGKGLSTNDFTDDLKNKLDTLSATGDETVSYEEIAALFTTSGSSEG